MHLTKGKGLSSDEADALKVYLERFGESRDGCNPGMTKITVFFFPPKSRIQSLGVLLLFGTLVLNLRQISLD